MFTFSLHYKLKMLNKLSDNVLLAGHNNFSIFMDNGVIKQPVKEVGQQLAFGEIK